MAILISLHLLYLDFNRCACLKVLSNPSITQSLQHDLDNLAMYVTRATPTIFHFMSQSLLILGGNSPLIHIHLVNGSNIKTVSCIKATLYPTMKR